MKNAFNYPLQPERLQKFGDWLSRARFKPSIELVEDSSHLIDELTLNVIPVFNEPIRMLPVLFPGEWSLTKSGQLLWKEDTHQSTLSSVTGFMGLSLDMFLHTFSPYAQSIDTYGGHILTRNSKPKDIAFNVLMLLKFQQAKMNLIPGINVFISKN